MADGHVQPALFQDLDEPRHRAGTRSAELQPVDRVVGNQVDQRGPAAEQLDQLLASVGPSFTPASRMYS